MRPFVIVSGVVVQYYDLLPASFKYKGGTGDELEKMQFWEV